MVGLNAAVEIRRGRNSGRNDMLKPHQPSIAKWRPLPLPQRHSESSRKEATTRENSEIASHVIICGAKHWMPTVKRKTLV